MEWISSPEAWIALGTLTLLEVVLGIDNIVFISILASRLPEADQNKARYGGLALALIMRVILLFSLSWLMSLTKPLFAIWEHAVSGRDLILMGGGLFLLAKATFEIHHKLEGVDESEDGNKPKASLFAILLQILVLDAVFSLDSVITAIGMADEIQIMIAAVVISIFVMMASMKGISAFVEKHPTVKMLALSFLLLIGFTLIAEGFHAHIPKGYIYFAMGFSLFVEMLNLRLSKKGKVVRLNKDLP